MTHDANSPLRGEHENKEIPADMLPAAEIPPGNCNAARPASDSHHPAKRKSHANGHVPERRGRRRAVISAPVRVRNVQATVGPDEVTTTLDVSRNGLLVTVSDSSFYRGMEVAVTFPYTSVQGAPQAEQYGRVVRVSGLAGNRYSMAIALGAAAAAADIVDAQGQKIERVPEIEQGWEAASAGPKKPMILAVDSDAGVRMSLKTYLQAEGYEVIAVGTADEALEVLNMFTPNLLIAEIEGADLPGYELCAHIKGTPRLQATPVVLLTSSAYPSDYSNAHSLGAVVCMAKPFRQERLGHVVRLLAPTPEAKLQTAPACTPDPQRKTVLGKKEASIKNSPARFRFRSPW